jgi:hypothetical protein
MSTLRLYAIYNGLIKDAVAYRAMHYSPDCPG